RFSRDWSSDVCSSDLARFLLVASPAYLQQHGEPTRVSELAEHEVVAYSYTQDLDEVSFTRAGKTQRVRVKRSMQANDAQIIRTRSDERRAGQAGRPRG